MILALKYAIVFIIAHIIIGFVNEWHRDRLAKKYKHMMFRPGYWYTRKD